MSNTLLITDDALIMRHMIRDAVEASGWEVVAEAQNGQQAVELYQQFRPTAVTMDLMMPEFDGLHGLREIRAVDPQAQVIVISAIDVKEKLKEAISLGARDFIVKPFRPEMLVDSLSRVTPVGAN